MNRRIELLRDVLDHEIVDVDGVRCGTVDDLEFEDLDGAPVVAAILVGPRAWQARLPALFAIIAGWLFGRGVTRIPWTAVGRLTQSVELKRKASEVGLGRIERKAARWLARIPGS